MNGSLPSYITKYYDDAGTRICCTPGCPEILYIATRKRYCAACASCRKYDQYSKKNPICQGSPDCKRKPRRAKLCYLHYQQKRDVHRSDSMQSSKRPRPAPHAESFGEILQFNKQAKIATSPSHRPPSVDDESEKGRKSYGRNNSTTDPRRPWRPPVIVAPPPVFPYPIVHPKWPRVVYSQTSPQVSVMHTDSETDLSDAPSISIGGYDTDTQSESGIGSRSHATPKSTRGCRLKWTNYNSVGTPNDEFHADEGTHREIGRLRSNER
jgi:hypothetical protein